MRTMSSQAAMKPVLEASIFIILCKKNRYAADRSLTGNNPYDPGSDSAEAK